VPEPPKVVGSQVLLKILEVGICGTDREIGAFAYGAPPHGGIAFGWDRICALLSGADSIREVIAFPKSGGGFDPLTGAPAPISAEQRKEARVDAAPAEDAPSDGRK